MKGIQIKINGEWIVFPEDFTVSLEQCNPLLNEQETFSFPFEIPLEPNRHVFRNIADPFGNIRLKDIDGMRAEVWFDGVLLYRGRIETDEEIEFEDSLPMTFLSGNSDFRSRIEGMSAQDVPIDENPKLGYVVTEARRKDYPRQNPVQLPGFIMMNYTEYNVADPYPIRKFCNARVCTSDEDGRLKVLEAKRPFSGVCFYLLYFIDSLFTYLQIPIDKTEINKVEDMNRLAFFNTRCEVEYGEEETVEPLASIRAEDFCGEDFELTVRGTENRVEVIRTSKDYDFFRKDVFATNRNFPDTTVTDIIDDLGNAFGLKIIYNSETNEANAVFLRDIYRNRDFVDLHAEILEVVLSVQKQKTVLLTYGVDDNTAFNYDDYSNMVQMDGYLPILQSGISAYNKNYYYDKKTGDGYRVKVNKETGSDPSLMEVGGFRDFLIGDKNDEDKEELKIKFTPVIVNDTKNKRTRRGGPHYDYTGGTEQEFSIFADVELKSAEDFDGVIEERVYDNRTTATYTVSIKAKCPENYDISASDEPPLRTYDAGYTLGIMRGAGREAGIEYVTLNYDGEGNDSWVQTVADYAFTSDTCDNFGRMFDYNGELEGGIEPEGRISLKLIAEKEDFPIDTLYAGRGLVSKFMAEHLYFLANRKKVILSVKMEIGQIVNLDFLRWYKIGEYVGLVNKVSYTLGMNGITETKIELYYI